MQFATTVWSGALRFFLIYNYESSNVILVVLKVSSLVARMDTMNSTGDRCIVVKNLRIASTLSSLVVFRF